MYVCMYDTHTTSIISISFDFTDFPWISDISPISPLRRLRMWSRSELSAFRRQATKSWTDRCSAAKSPERTTHFLGGTGWEAEPQEMVSPRPNALLLEKTSGIQETKSGFNEQTERFHHEGHFKRLNYQIYQWGWNTIKHVFFSMCFHQKWGMTKTPVEYVHWCQLALPRILVISSRL